MLTCQQCGSAYPERLKADGSVRKTQRPGCSVQCVTRLYEVSRKPREKRVRMARGVCLWCNVSYERIRCGDSPNLFCSRQCSGHYTTSLNILAARAYEASLVAREIEALKRIARYREAKPKRYKRACLGCGEVSVQDTKAHKRCEPCKAVRLIQLRETWKASEDGKRSIRHAKGRRRALERNAFVEDVDPLAVFEAQDWTCQSCGELTPRSLRGSYDRRAPELDHVIPLSKGGLHCYANVQCLCRSCNLSKSDKIIPPGRPQNVENGLFNLQIGRAHV